MTGSEPHITTISKARLDFLPWSQEDLQIRHTFCDLLLVSPKNDNREYCICNFLTKQNLRLPRAPISDMTDSALVFESKSCDKRLGCNCDIRYKVVLIKEQSQRDLGRGSGLQVIVFCSETGGWSQTSVRDCWDSEPKLNGCWLGLVGKSLLNFHPFERPGEQMSWISLPDHIFSRNLFNTITTAIIGLLKGRLRLAELTWEVEESRHLLKIWDRNLSGHCDLVHDIELKGSADHGTAQMTLYASHPTDENIMFVHCATTNNIWMHNIVDGSGQSPVVDQIFIDSLNRFDYYTLHRHSTPTVIPPLSNQLL